MDYTQISRYRKRRGMTRSQLALEMAVDVEVINEWENGLETPTTYELSRLENILRIPTDTLIALGEAPYKRYLSPDEEILWEGQPDLRKNLDRSDAFLIPFSIFWFGFAIAWTVITFLFGGFFFLFGIPFLAVGYWIAIGRLIYRKKLKRYTYYGITNQRIVISTGIKHQSFTEIPLVSIQNMNIEVTHNGVGTILFNGSGMEKYAMMYYNSGAQFINRYQQVQAFSDIPQANEVYQIIKDAIEQAKNKV